MGDFAQGTRARPPGPRCQDRRSSGDEPFEACDDLGVLRGDVGRFAQIGLEIEQLRGCPGFAAAFVALSVGAFVIGGRASTSFHSRSRTASN